MHKSKLFRPTAINANQVKWLGDIVITRPVAFSTLTAIAGVFAGILIVFLIFGTYTKRATVTGLLVPDTGLVKIFARQSGIVIQKYVTESQVVEKGDVLYVVSSERQNSSQGNIQATISNQVEMRRESLQHELDKTRRLQIEERQALIKRIDGLTSELFKIESQIEGQKGRAKLAEDAVGRSQELLVRNFISREQVQQKQADFLDQRYRLQSLERDHISIGLELSSKQSELASLALRHQNQLAQIERGITSIEQEFTENEAKRRLEITAPESGIATAVTAEVGQNVEANMPLVSIVPTGSTLQAQLYAPSKAVGFIKSGDSVLLRYQAFPFQKFGHAMGQVKFVSKTALPSNELSGLGISFLNGGSANGEPLYRITVDLVEQTINANGKQEMLRAGMLLDADILQETRHLYEWVLEPLFSLTGKLEQKEKL